MTSCVDQTPRICIVCGESFIPTTAKKKCCGYKCSHQNWLNNNKEVYKTYQREYGRKLREEKGNYPYTSEEKTKERNKKYREENREAIRAKARESYKQRKLKEKQDE